MIIILIILSAGCSMAGILGDEGLRPLIQRTIAMRFEHRYAEADSILRELRDEYPDDPAPLFLRGSNLHDDMMNREDYRRFDEMTAIFDSAISMAKRGNPDAWNYWIIGSSLGYKAIALAELGRYLAAFKTSAEAVGYLERAFKTPETRADAALGIGGYHYWKSAKLGLLTYLPFVPDHRREGIEYLRLARTESLYSRDAAIHALVYVFCEEEMVDSAEALRDTIRMKYPGSLLPLWYDLLIAGKKRDLENYFYAADELSCALDTLGDEQIINRVETHLLAATAASELEDWDFVCVHCTAVLEEHFPPWVIKNNRSRINELKELAITAAEKGAACPKFP